MNKLKMSTFFTIDCSRAAEIAALNQSLILDEGSSNSMTAAELTKRMKRWLSSDYQCVAVEAQAEIISYCLFRLAQDHLYIRQLFTVSAHRGKGLAKGLIAHIENTHADGREIRLEVLSGNQSALKFYQSIGFNLYSHELRRKA